MVVASVIGLMWVLGNQLIIRQTQALVHVTRKLAKGDLTVRTGLNYQQGELGQLAQAFDGMADQLAQRDAEREKNLAALGDYATELEQSNRELRDFTNIASHDMQEPLRKIQTFGELLAERSASGLDERGLDYLRRMQGAAQRMQILIDGLLTYSRLTTKAQSFELVNMTQITRQVVNDLDWQIEQKGAKIDLAELPEVEADSLQMAQLMQNLIGNALKFHAKDRSPVVRIYSSEQTNSCQDGWCKILVEDEGIGFDEKYLDRIFQPFQRLHDRDQFDGVGMGLAICRKIVERHGGCITAQSAKGEGSTFIIKLPRLQADERGGWV